jgi:hypothetical protein
MRSTCSDSERFISTCNEVRRERGQMEQRVRQLEKFEALGKLAGGVVMTFIMSSQPSWVGRNSGSAA